MWERCDNTTNQWYETKQSQTKRNEELNNETKIKNRIKEPSDSNK